MPAFMSCRRPDVCRTRTRSMASHNSLPRSKSKGDYIDVFAMATRGMIGARMTGNATTVAPRKGSSICSGAMWSAARGAATNSLRVLASTDIRGNWVFKHGEMRAGARPAPVPRALDQTRPHRIERDVAQRGGGPCDDDG